ncbi:MAG: DMT family transporter [Muribaculaceae bacterium]|nr:DMT family transporter [Bacteroidales bacterium]MDY2931496.1 DMT family transporter [Muribaculaceae bacterium]MDY5118367.1 DMT family transporter [Muribaculaceae bacterium]
MKSKSSIIGHMACFVAYAIFGVNIVTTKDLTASHLVSPLALFTVRSVCAGALFWLISFFMPGERVAKEDYLKIFAASILGFFFTQITFLMAISEITPMDCSIVSALSPIYTMFIAAVAIKEPITWRKAGGVALSFAGAVYLIINSVSSGGATSTTLRGVVLIVLNSLCFSLYLGIFRPVIQRYSAVTFMKWIFLFSTLLSLPVSAMEFTRIDYAAFTPTLVGELAYLVVGATFVSYLLIPIGQQRIRPTLVSMYSYVQPIVAIAISIIIGMDTLSWQKVIAAATVFGGVVIVSYSRSAKNG